MTTPVIVCGVCADNNEEMTFLSIEDRLAHMQEKHQDFLAKNRPTRVDIMIDGQKPLDMWTYEELSARRAELMDQMNNLYQQVAQLQKEIVTLTPHLNQCVSRMLPEDVAKLKASKNLLALSSDTITLPFRVSSPMPESASPSPEDLSNGPTT